MRKKILIWIGGVVSVVVICCLAMIVTILMSTRHARTTALSDVPNHRVAIIFGAHVQTNGEPSPILKDRVQGGVDLYKAGTVQKLLMSGDNSYQYYNEAQAMVDYAVKLGVPKADIVADYAGRSTYDTCYRASHIFGLTNAVLVTQRYHMPRAIYTCQHVGVQADGYALEDFSKYPDLRVSYTIRETGALIKAWVDVHVLHPQAEIMGNPEPAI